MPKAPTIQLDKTDAMTALTFLYIYLAGALLVAMRMTKDAMHFFIRSD